MTIIALEGPSGVGKSTTAAALEERHDAVRIPEVNELFEHPGGDAHGWYLDRQCERWRIATEHEEDRALVVLDGDPFQPLWYNWIARGLNRPDPFEEAPSLDSIARFYRRAMERRVVGFPDRYVVLCADEERLRTRKENDATRRRGNFEYHLRFVAHHRRYFERLESLDAGRVTFVDAETRSGARRAVAEAVPTGPTDRFPSSVLDSLIEWLGGAEIR